MVPHLFQGCERQGEPLCRLRMWRCSAITTAKTTRHNPRLPAAIGCENVEQVSRGQTFGMRGHGYLTKRSGFRGGVLHKAGTDSNYYKQAFPCWLFAWCRFGLEIIEILTTSWLNSLATGTWRISFFCIRTVSPDEELPKLRSVFLIFRNAVTIYPDGCRFVQILVVDPGF